MCFYSVVMSDGLNWPPSRLQDKEWREYLERMMRIAEKYDRDHAQPDCDAKDKKEALAQKARDVGVELKFPEPPIGD